MDQTPTAGTAPAAPADAVADLVAESGSYELLRKRLADQGEALAAAAQALNAARIAEFGRTDSRLLLRTRARTENNCVARDLVRIGDTLLFGYNVFIGLRKETRVEDVFALYRLPAEGQEELEPAPLAGSFLEDPRFVADFRELYAYYRQASLTQLRVNNHRLLAAFRIGQQLYDIRVFRWSLEADGRIVYLDNRGERDIVLPAAHDFEWVPTTRDDHVGGRHPHVNVLDTVFIDTVGGDLTIKVENNTETGLGIYAEPVEDRTQSLVDAEVAYARLGALILLKIRPYRESAYRYLVYSTRTQQVARIDAIGQSCVTLPEDHGIVFPGGYYLQSGEHKRFDLPPAALEGLQFKRMVRSPNGEDVLYVFYQPGPGTYALFGYNLIEKKLATPILSQGYARFDDGRIIVFQSQDEPTRAHPMQVWQTPFLADDHAARMHSSQTFFGRIGNPELVRGVSELLAIARAVREQSPTRTAYEDLIRQCGRVVDAFHWLDAPEAGQLAGGVRAIAENARAALDEFEKVAAIRRDAARSLAEAEGAQRALLTDVASMLWQSPDDFVRALDRMRAHRGNLLALKERRYIDVGRIEALDAAAAAEQARVGERATVFLAEPKSFDPYRATLARLGDTLPKAATTSEVVKIVEALDAIAHALDLLTEQLGSLPGGDAIVRTRILDLVAGIYADVNRLRAEARNRRKSLGTVESAAEFGAQLKLLAQAVENALDFADTPEKCDENLTRLLAQLEELEGRFGEQEAFLADIAAKREAVYEAFAARKQMLLEARTRRTRTLVDAATRILDGVPRRVAQLADPAQVHAYFASDALVGKLRSLIADLRAIDAQLPADDLDTRLKTARDQALRAVRDRQELVAADGTTIRIGRHAFTVSRQPLDLMIVPRGEALAFHLNGTDYFEPVEDARFAPLARFWEQALVSETDALYRGEYLAARFLEAVAAGAAEPGPARLAALAAAGAEGEPELLEHLRKFAAVRYQEGYQKGVHDADAARLVAALAAMDAHAGLLRHPPLERALALAYWTHGCDEPQRAALVREARSALQLRDAFGTPGPLQRLVGRLAESLSRFDASFGFAEPGAQAPLWGDAAEYLAVQLAANKSADGWVTAGAGEDLAQAFARHLERGARFADWKQALDAASPPERWRIARDWIAAFAGAEAADRRDWIDDAAATFAFGLPRTRVNAELDRTVTGLLGDHPRIASGTLRLNLNDFRRRFLRHCAEVVPAFEALNALRQEVLAAEKTRLRLGEFQAKPLSSFVRNRLIDEVYLPLIGDNLAKQLGAAGDANRTDRMGMLLLISPPGYGKTTLMEYIADRLGVIFVRINCPALGNDVTSIDPGQATHAAARQELEKLNLALAMGNNTMLYLDDIQHTNPELLQKFIALCDATRRIEGVWNGTTRTYDLRGKRFAVVMAGNPYTESGEVFRIPDMLANRADIYNLGDVLSGREALFALSYVENSVTANPVTLPLAARDARDVQRLVRLAQGEDVPASEFAHTYAAAELAELKGVLQRLFRVRDVLLKVNLAYIGSAAQADDYRTEPPFKLQGSYRNMAKLAAKVTAIMRDDELDALLRDHYRGEAQTLAAGAEENLLKLAELLGTMTAAEAARWADIKAAFARQKKLGGNASDPAARIAASLLDIGRALDGLREQDTLGASLREGLGQIEATLKSLRAQVVVSPPDSRAFAEAVQRMAESYDKVLVPLVTASYHKLRMDHSIWDEVREISAVVKRVAALADAQAPAAASLEPQSRRGGRAAQAPKPPGRPGSEDDR